MEFLLKGKDTLVIKGVKNPKLVWTHIEKILSGNLWTLVKTDFDHATSTWTVVYDRTPGAQRQVSGPDNQFGRPESDLI